MVPLAALKPTAVDTLLGMRMLWAGVGLEGGMRWSSSGSEDEGVVLSGVQDKRRRCLGRSWNLEELGPPSISTLFLLPPLLPALSPLAGKEGALGL